MLGSGLPQIPPSLKNFGNKKPCRRCNLSYNHQKHTICPHCGHLDDAGLAQLLEQRAQYQEGNKNLGALFLIFALLGLVIMLLAAL